MKKEYIYRPCDDGTFDVLCLYCFEYINRMCTEETLRDVEKKHMCMQKKVALLKQP